MEFRTFYPRHPLLAEHIAYFYYIRSARHDFSTSYYAFPHIYNGLSIYKSADYRITENSLTTFSNDSNRHQAYVQSRYQFPLKITLNGPIDKVTIVFKPLGINHYIDADFADITERISQPFDQWQSREYQIFLNHFYASDDFELRTALLEKFLLTVLKSFPDQLVMKKAIELISDLEVKFDATKIATGLHISVRTFNRLFTKHLGLSPIAYRKVLQFRESLKNKLYNEQYKRLTDICYESNFYDPSYFNRIFKQFTGSNPSRFFKSVDNKGVNTPLFQYLDK